MLSVRDLLIVIIGYMGYIKGITRLHKLIFLLTKESGLHFKIEFIPHLYGPWSPQIHHAINSLVKEKIIHIYEKPAVLQDESGPKICVLTTKGEEEFIIINNNLTEDERNKILEFLHKYRNVPITYLISYVYAKYPQYTILSKISDKVNLWRKVYGLRW